MRVLVTPTVSHWLVVEITYIVTCSYSCGRLRTMNLTIIIIISFYKVIDAYVRIYQKGVS
jgi:hypothetical protein